MLQTGLSFFVFFAIIFGRVMAGPLQVRATPTVQLDRATVTGLASGPTNKFLGIPFAQPPTGNLRFRPPKRLPPYNTSFSATEFGLLCPQQLSTIPPLPFVPPDAFNDPNSLASGVSSEDCLTLNVITPAGATPTSKLPVVVWFVGGGFAKSGTSVYDGSPIVEKSVSLGVPAIYVEMNYRLNAFGFLASKEVKAAGVGNLGLRDQRLALQWVQEYISAFGGDPTKVTIWGGSAGAMSIALQMLTNGGNTEGLFRAAFMQSGAPLPVGDITNGQPYYDALVEETGCSGAEDTLQCLREAPYQSLIDAVDKSPGIFSYQSLVLAWRPRVDGEFLTADPQELVQQGSVANIPFVSGNCDDEGTWFSFSTLNVTTDAQVEEYIRTYWLPNASNAAVAELMTYYPSDPSQGSPFDTGDLNALSPQYKRFAAFQGDAVFQAPRRFFLQNRSGKQNIWSFLSKREKSVPYLGSSHGSDVEEMYTGGDMTSYLVRFIANLDPNVGESEDLYWPQYRYGGTANQTMLEFSDGPVRQALTTDTYRVDAISYLTNVTLANPI